MNNQPPYAGPPWAAPELWAEANAALLRLCAGQGMGPARALAEELARALDSLEPAMERLCGATCPRCLEPCCVRARVWADFPDLLFMHLSGQALPVAQLRAEPGGPCAHLGPKGCRLPRLSRPWVCTWYLCPEQKARLRAWSPEERRAVERGLARVKELRGAMAAAAALQ
ncbi:MAG: hypothetical protein KQH53_19210 [Desulfarculaceae bacterium]|nr:hypothetical protein [Desulfarculaceae bacterium]